MLLVSRRIVEEFMIFVTGIASMSHGWGNELDHDVTESQRSSEPWCARTSWLPSMLYPARIRSMLEFGVFLIGISSILCLFTKRTIWRRYLPCLDALDTLLRYELFKLIQSNRIRRWLFNGRRWWRRSKKHEGQFIMLFPSDLHDLNILVMAWAASSCSLKSLRI